MGALKLKPAMRQRPTNAHAVTVPRARRCPAPRHARAPTRDSVSDRYPVLGIDDRTQFDLIACLPGGLRGLAAVVDELHEASWRSNMNVTTNRV